MSIINRLFALAPRVLNSVAHALASETIPLGALRLRVRGSRPIRLSVVLGNLRMQHIMDTLLRPGDTVIDVGANLGYNTLYAAQCIGPQGHVYAVEPAQDNLAELYFNLIANHVRNVTVLPYAAGARREVKRFYLRGEVSAVNSFYQDNFYHPITGTVEVLAIPLDDLAIAPPRLVKLDVEGGELEVLHGMARMLTDPMLSLVVEWHPTLQQAAGYAPDALPEYLLAHDFTLHAVTHTHAAPLNRQDIPRYTAALLARRAPVELLAMRYPVTHHATT